SLNRSGPEQLGYGLAQGFPIALVWRRTQHASVPLGDLQHLQPSAVARRQLLLQRKPQHRQQSRLWPPLRRAPIQPVQRADQLGVASPDYAVRLETHVLA